MLNNKAHLDALQQPDDVALVGLVGAPEIECRSGGRQDRGACGWDFEFAAQVWAIGNAQD